MNWIILRTGSRNTLKLVKDLVKDGYVAWTPARTFRKRAPRNLGTYEITAPMLPSFAFARADHIHALLELSDSPRKPCPDFSVFHYLNGIPIVGDAELNSLRRLEENDRKRLEAQRRIDRKREVLFNPGDLIKVTVGAFSGMSGTVTNDDGRFALICFGDMNVKISTSLLSAENLICEPRQLKAA
jgi:hypothetical protein